MIANGIAAAIFEPRKYRADAVSSRIVRSRSYRGSVIRDFDTSLAANRVSFDIESFTTGYLIRRNNRDFSSYSHRDRRENGNNRSIFSLLYSSRIYRYSICTLSYYSFLLVIIRDSLIHCCNYRI